MPEWQKVLKFCLYDNAGSDEVLCKSISKLNSQLREWGKKGYTFDENGLHIKEQVEEAIRRGDAVEAAKRAEWLADWMSKA
jgi:hypothetical protein